MLGAAVLEEDEDLRQREQADDRDEEVDPVIEMHLAEGEARHAGLRVDADHRQPQPERGGKGGLGLVGRRDAAQRHEGQREEREILRRPEQQRHLHQLRRQQHQPPGGEERADEGGDARQRQRLARPALLGHRVAVEAGHHRRLVAGDVEQDRADPPAIHRPVIDRGQQDQRRRRAEAQREGQRDQDRDAVRRAEPGQRAHDRAQKAAHAAPAPRFCQVSATAKPSARFERVSMRASSEAQRAARRG